MKSDIHPEYRYVVFRDVNNGYELVTRSCAHGRDTATIEGEEVPLINMDVSSASHPFYTGTQKIMDREGRVERFMRKYGFAGDPNDIVGGNEDESADEAAAPVEAAPVEAAPAAVEEPPAPAEEEAETEPEG